MTTFESHESSCVGRLISRCEALTGHIGDAVASTLFGEIRQLVEEIPEWGLPMPQFLVRTVVAGILLRCIRGTTSDVRHDLTPVLLDFATGRAAPDAFHLECLKVIDHCHETISGGPQVSGDHDTLHHVLNVIQARHCDANLTLRQISHEVQRSISHVSRLVNRHAGCGFRAHLNRIRISSAQRLLQSSSLSIKQVAASVGYRSTSQLDRQFRQICDTTPALFRRNARLPIRSHGLAVATLRPRARTERPHHSNATE